MKKLLFLSIMMLITIFKSFGQLPITVSHIDTVGYIANSVLPTHTTMDEAALALLKPDKTVNLIAHSETYRFNFWGKPSSQTTRYHLIYYAKTKTLVESRVPGVYEYNQMIGYILIATILLIGLLGCIMVQAIPEKRFIPLIKKPQSLLKYAIVPTICSCISLVIIYIIDLYIFKLSFDLAVQGVLIFNLIQIMVSKPYKSMMTLLITLLASSVYLSIYYETIIAVYVMACVFLGMWLGWYFHETHRKYRSEFTSVEVIA